MATVKRVGRPALDDDVLHQRKRLILDRTLGLVAQRGTSNVRLKDVAASANVSVGTLQHYFDSRDQLIREAFTQHAYGVIDDVLDAQSPTATPWEALRTMFANVYAGSDLAQRCALWIEFVAASRHDDRLRELMAEFWNAWSAPIRHAVRRGVDDGSFAPVTDVDSVVATILAIIDGGETAVALKVRAMDRDVLTAELQAAAAALLGVSGPAALH
ncbi:MAG: TetR family transcriptional regulator [Nocardioides sp.]|nr:TetR family transcriptional regulator [Nocardioides sp.]